MRGIAKWFGRGVFALGVVGALSFGATQLFAGAGGQGACPPPSMGTCPPDDPNGWCDWMCQMIDPESHGLCRKDTNCCTCSS